MGVNLAGIEIILNMREKMIEMEKQMGEFAQVVQQELSRVASRAPTHAERHAIVRANTKSRAPAPRNLASHSKFKSANADKNRWHFYLRRVSTAEEVLRDYPHALRLPCCRDPRMLAVVAAAF